MKFDAKAIWNKKLEMIDSSCPSMDSSSSSELDENLENSHSILDKDPYFTEPTLVAFRQKLWYYLFRNMNHAIDELYCMCELESSIEQGELADRVLKSCSLDFTKLVDRLKVQSKMPADRKAMAWEVKKMSNFEKPNVVRALEQMAATRDVEHRWMVDNQLEDSALGDSALNDSVLSDSALSDSVLSDHPLSESHLGDSQLSDNQYDDSPLGDSELSNSQLSNSPLSRSMSYESLASTSSLQRDDVFDDFSDNECLRYEGTVMTCDELHTEVNYKSRKMRLVIDTSQDSSAGEWSPTQSYRTLHDKLSSPERRKRSPSETKRLQEERFFNAQLNRGKIDSERQRRFQLKAERLKDVNERNARKLALQEEMMWAKLGRADALHEAHLRWIVRKAGSENTKVDEVGFIKSLTKENRKASLNERLENVTARRKQWLQQIKTRASENLENVRAASKRRDEKLESAIAEKHAANKKRHQDVETRKISLQLEMKQKIMDMANKECIVKERRENSENKRGKVRMEGNAKDSYGEPAIHCANESSSNHFKTRKKVMRQTAKRIRRKLAATSPGYQDSYFAFHIKVSEHVERHYERLLFKLDVDHDFCGNHLKLVSLSTQLETVGSALQDLLQFQEDKDERELHFFRCLGGIHRVAKWASRATAAVSRDVATTALKALCSSCILDANRDYLLATNCLPELVDLTVWSLNRGDDTELMESALDAVTLPLRHHTTIQLETVRQNVIPYIVNAGVMMIIAKQFEQFRRSFSSDTDSNVLFKCVGFLEAITALGGHRVQPVLTMADLRLPIVNVFKDTGLMGIVSLLISLLMESKPQRRSESFVLTPRIISISSLALKVLNNVARLDVNLVQQTLSTGSLQQEFIHMLGYFLTTCADCANATHTEILLQEVLILIGYYSLQNSKTQETLRWGNSPNLIQQLTTLPFSFYSESSLSDILFPTLICICYRDTENTRILEQELSPLMLVVYIRERWEQQCTPERRSDLERHSMVEDCAAEDIEQLPQKDNPSMDECQWKRFAHRFPVFLWKDALNCFLQCE